MNLGEMNKNGQLKIVENVNELYNIWKGIKKMNLKNLLKLLRI